LNPPNNNYTNSNSNNNYTNNATADVTNENIRPSNILTNSQPASANNSQKNVLIATTANTNKTLGNHLNTASTVATAGTYTTNPLNAATLNMYNMESGSITVMNAVGAIPVLGSAFGKT
jgi:hypothetical protein